MGSKKVLGKHFDIPGRLMEIFVSKSVETPPQGCRLRVSDMLCVVADEQLSEPLGELQDLPQE